MLDILTSRASCDRQEHVTKYKNMRKWMVEFLRRFEDRDIKIDRVNYNYLLSFCTLLGVRCDVEIVKLTASAQSIY